MPFGVVGTAEDEIDNSLGIFFAVPASVAGVDFLPFFLSEVETLELGEDLYYGADHFG